MLGSGTRFQACDQWSIIMDNKVRYLHACILRNDVQEEEIASIARVFRDVAEEMGLKTTHVWEGQHHGRSAVFFGSDDLREHARLQIRLFGEAVGVGNHRHAHTFVENDNAYEKAWLKCAKSVLADQGVRYQYTADAGHKYTFYFNRCSDCFYFSSLIECGYIDALIFRPTLEVPYGRRDFLNPPCDVG